MHGTAIAFSLSLLASLAAAAAVEEPVGILAKQCKFALGDRHFDMCPVFEGNEGGWTVSRERQTPPTVTKDEYRISFQGPLKRSKKIASDDHVRLMFRSTSVRRTMLLCRIQA